MKRLRTQRWSRQLLAARSGAIASPPAAPHFCCYTARQRVASVRNQSTTTTTTTSSGGGGGPEIIYEDGPGGSVPDSTTTTTPFTTTTSSNYRPLPTENSSSSTGPYPSPLPENALRSAKLAALHARLGLPSKVPLQTLARTLVDASADGSPRFNNSNLAFLGMTLINYHTCEWLMCRYPRLPMMIMYAAMRAYAGPESLLQIAQQWGVECAAAPGEEVDPGLLQFSLDKDRQVMRRWGYERAEAPYLEKYKWRHGISSRVVLDDDFGDTVTGPLAGERMPEQEEEEEGGPQPQSPLGSLDSAAKMKVAADVHANFVRAVVGAVYAHGGREAARAFVEAHVLSRQLDVSRLFKFKLPTRELAYLCAREDFEPPVARLEAETGRKSRTPVFVVGIYSGRDKLGEGTAASLDHARAKAAMNSLKAWYLYSPGENVRLPSDMLVQGAKPWEPAYIDIGEII